jgi:hypothetical protein
MTTYEPSSPAGELLEVLTDYRLGGAPRRYLGLPEERLVRVPDAVLKCTVFVCSCDGTTLTPEGTAFFVGLPIEGYPDMHAVHLVTAAHVVDKTALRTMDGIHIRLNLKGGGYETIRIQKRDHWFRHPTDQLVDVAVFGPWTLDTTNNEVMAFPIAIAATTEVIEQDGIGIGDEVFFSGLFERHAGRGRNLPIVRIGNIAMMNHEPIATDEGDLDAYLIEARSIGGLSGSPVFVRTYMTRGRGGDGPLASEVIRWLGIVEGHWDGRLSRVDAARAGRPEEVNLGIAVVAPASRVLEVLYQPSLVEARQEYARAILKGNGLTRD